MKFEKFKLNEKTALITGAAGLLGIEHASALLESGAKVVLTDINISFLENTKIILSKDFDKEKIIIHTMDVSKVETIKKVSDILSKNNVYIDILINNAAIDPKVQKGKNSLELSRFENFPIKQWEAQISVGLTGSFLCSQIFGTIMAKNTGGVILNIASDLSICSPDQRLYKKKKLDRDKQPVKPVTYSVIKTGLIGLTRYLSTYWTENGKVVRCNALSPGGIYNNQNKEFVKRLCKLIPLARMASSDEYRSAVQFLCSDASSYMNGQNIVMDGGRSIW